VFATRKVHTSSSSSSTDGVVEMSSKEGDGDALLDDNDVGASNKLNIRRFASTTRATSYDRPKFTCKTPSTLIGVQNDSPISFSRDGMKFAFVLGNFSVLVLKWSSNKFAIHKTLVGHVSRVYTLEFSNGSNSLLMSGGDDGMRLWDAEKGTIISEIKIGKDKTSHNDLIECGCWTHEGETFVTGSRDNDLKAWDIDLKSGKLNCLETIFGHKAAVLDVRFCSKNQFLASCGRDSVIKLWDAKTLSKAYRAKRADDSGIKCLLLGTMSGHRGDVTTLSFDLSGKFLFSGARDNTIMLWSTENRNRIRQVHDTRGAAGTSTHAGDISRIKIVYGSDKKTAYSLSSSLDSYVIVMKLGKDIANGIKVQEDDSKQEDIGTESKEEDVISKLTQNSELTKSTVLSSKELNDTISFRQFVHDDEGVSQMEYNTHLNVVATVSPMNRVTIWKIKDVFSSSQGDDGVDVVASPSSSQKNIMQQSRNPILDLTQTFVGHNKKVTAIEMLSENGTYIVSSSEDYSVNVYDIKKMKREMTFNFGSSALTMAVRFRNNSFTRKNADCIFVGGTAYDIQALSLDSTRYENVMRSCYGLNSVQTTEYQCGLRLVGHSGKVRCAEIDPTGTILASCSEDFSIAIWKIKARADKPVVSTGLRPGEQINRCRNKQSTSCVVSEHNGHVTSLSFTDLFNDKKTCYLASCSSDHSLIVWNVNYGGLISSVGLSVKWKCLSAHLSVVSDVCWGHENTKDWLFTAGWDHNISVWKLGMPHTSKEVSAPLRTLWGHTARVACVAVTKNGKSLVSAGADCCAILWDLSDRNIDTIRALCKYPTDSPITAMTTGFDTFVTGEMSGVIRVWNTMDRSVDSKDAVGLKDAMFELTENKSKQEGSDGAYVEEKQE